MSWFQSKKAVIKNLESETAICLKDNVEVLYLNAMHLRTWILTETRKERQLNVNWFGEDHPYRIRTKVEVTTQ